MRTVADLWWLETAAASSGQAVTIEKVKIRQRPPIYLIDGKMTLAAITFFSSLTTATNLPKLTGFVR